MLPQFCENFGAISTVMLWSFSKYRKILNNFNYLQAINLIFSFYGRQAPKLCCLTHQNYHFFLHAHIISANNACESCNFFINTYFFLWIDENNVRWELFRLNAQWAVSKAQAAFIICKEELRQLWLTIEWKTTTTGKKGKNNV